MKLSVKSKSLGFALETSKDTLKSIAQDRGLTDEKRDAVDTAIKIIEYLNRDRVKSVTISKESYV